MDYNKKKTVNMGVGLHETQNNCHDYDRTHPEDICMTLRPDQASFLFHRFSSLKVVTWQAGKKKKINPSFDFGSMTRIAIQTHKL